MAFRTNQVQVDGSINIDGSIFQFNVPFSGGVSNASLNLYILKSGGAVITGNLGPNSAGYYRLVNDQASDVKPVFVTNTNSPSTGLGGTQGTLSLIIGGVEKLMANSTGIGIGINPQAPLHIQSYADNFPQARINASLGENVNFPDAGIRFRSSATVTGIHADIFVKGVSVNETGRMGFRVPYSDERMSILSDGKIGIGTPNPSSNLHIYGDGGAFASFTISGSGEQGIRVLNTAGVGGIRNSMKWANRNDRDWTWITYTDTLATGVHDDWQLQNRNGVVLNCTSTGRVGIGTSNFITRESSSGTAYTVQTLIDMGATASVFGLGLFGVPRFVMGNTNSGGNRVNTAEIYHEVQSSVEGNEYGKLHLRTKQSSGPQSTAITIDASQRVGIGNINPSYNLDVTGTIRSTGDMTATNFNLSSDEKLKTSVIPIKISPIDIKYKEFELLSQPGQKRYGVIAQELQKTNPELVRIDPEGLLNVAYIDLLIKEIASLKERVTELEKLKA